MTKKMSKKNRPYQSIVLNFDETEVETEAKRLGL